MLHTLLQFHNLLPVVGTTLYVFYPKKLRLTPNILYNISLIHNAFLIGFSLWTFISLSQILYEDGFVIEANYYFSNPTFDTVIYYFYLSKYYEYFDTFLLYLNGKTPIFLQKYHHVGAVICWHLCYYWKVDSIWVITLFNSFVHTIMYSYYLGALLKFQFVKIIKPHITSMQLFQLSLQPLCLYAYNDESLINMRINYIFTVYISGLIILFSEFYYKAYIKDNKTKLSL